MIYAILCFYLLGVLLTAKKFIQYTKKNLTLRLLHDPFSVSASIFTASVFWFITWPVIIIMMLVGDYK